MQRRTTHSNEKLHNNKFHVCTLYNETNVLNESVINEEYYTIGLDSGDHNLGEAIVTS